MSHDGIACSTCETKLNCCTHKVLRICEDRGTDLSANRNHQKTINIISINAMTSRLLLEEHIVVIRTSAKNLSSFFPITVIL